MWETWHSTAELGYFKTPTLQATLRIKSKPQEMSCVFLELAHLFQSAGCAKNKHQFLMAPLSLKSFLLDAGLRLDGLPALDLWDIGIEVLRTTKDNIQPGHTSSGKLGQIQPDHTSSGNFEYVQPDSTLRDSRTNTKRVNRKQGVDQLNEVDCAPPTHVLLKVNLSCTSLKTTKPWSRW